MGVSLAGLDLTIANCTNFVKRLLLCLHNVHKNGFCLYVCC
uniref:Uncharacterized protein n=1 Tax=Siphoviridae sp. ct5op20 TaxID=2826295 RepID=A0A8S5NR57_9CAUD|nr:MAG TPA: hypothetical protein [Siphoviridae sp. ct5op20]DAM79995.1 MAG TPA: hypothetical protein [Caudoviricetes sp.]